MLLHCSHNSTVEETLAFVFLERWMREHWTLIASASAVSWKIRIESRRSGIGDRGSGIEYRGSRKGDRGSRIEDRGNNM